MVCTITLPERERDHLLERFRKNQLTFSMSHHRHQVVHSYLIIKIYVLSTPASCFPLTIVHLPKPFFWVGKQHLLLCKRTVIISNNAFPFLGQRNSIYAFLTFEKKKLQHYFNILVKTSIPIRVLVSGTSDVLQAKSKRPRHSFPKDGSPCKIPDNNKPSPV